MKLSPNAIHRLLPLALGALIGLSSTAFAQDSDPLAGCKDKSLRFVGPTGTDPKTKRQFVSGEVRVACDGTAIDAEEISWDDKTVWATGDVLVSQDGLRINADRMEMDRQTKLGTFFGAYGTARLSDAPVKKSLFGAMEPEVWFQGERIERIGPHRYKLTNGSFSTCVQANPRWVMVSTSATIVLDEYAVLKHVQFRVKGVPVFYFPYLYYPLKKEDRATGFLIPTYSRSDVRGQGFSTAFFWAIARFQDATFYHDYFSKTGQGAAVDYRYAAPQGSGDVRVHMLVEKERLAADGTVLRPAGRSFDMRGSMNQSIGRSFQLIGRLDYATDMSTRQLYQQNTYDLSNRTRLISMTLSGRVKRLDIRALFERNDLFTGLTSQGRTIQPQVRVSMSDMPIGKARLLQKIYFGASGEVGSFELRDPSRPQPEIGVQRMHGSVRLQAPLSPLKYLTLTTNASLNATRWLDSLDPLTGLPVPVPINRSQLNLGADFVGPLLERIFETPGNGFAERFKHRIEPRVSASWLSAFDRDAEIIQVDQLDRTVAGSTTVNYSLTNIVSARRQSAGGAGTWRPLLSLSIGQSFYTKPQAGAFDPQYPTGVAGDFSAVRVDASISLTDDVSGFFRMFIDSKARAVQSFSASTSIRVPRLQLRAGWSKTLYVPGLPGFSDPNGTTHTMDASSTFETTDGRFGGTYGFNLDVKSGKLVQQRVIAHYNAQCCGIAVDYQVIGVSQFLPGLRSDRRVAISFTLAGIGSFSYPLGGFGQ